MMPLFMFATLAERCSYEIAIPASKEFVKMTNNIRQ